MNRFDLEQAINSLFGTIDDLDLLIEDVLEKDSSKDEIANALIGIKTILNMKHQKIFDTFKAVFQLDEYHIKKDYSNIV